MKKKFVIRFGIVLIFLGLWLGALVPGVTQNYELQYFNQEDRLLGRNQGTILDDEQGYLWMSGFRGLTRFDGRHFMTLHSGSNADIRIDFEDIGSMYKLQNGEFAFLKSRAGIGLFNPKTYQFRTVSFKDLLPGNPIIVSLNEVKGSIYVCLESAKGIAMASYDGTTIKPIFRQDTLRADAINLRDLNRPKLFIVPYNADKYLFFDVKQGYHCYDSKTHLFTPLVFPSDLPKQERWPYFMIKEESLGWLLSFTDTEGLFTLDENLNVVRHPDFDKEIIYKTYARDSLGNLLFSATKNGVYTCFLFDNEQHSLTEIENLTYTSLFAFCTWSENYKKSLFKIGPEGLIYGQQPTYEITPLLAKAPKNTFGIGMRNMLKLANGLILLGTDRDGLYLYDPLKKTTTQLITPAQWPEDLKPITYSRTLLKDLSGSIWLTAFAEGPPDKRPSGYLIKFNEKSLQLDTFFSMPSRVESMAFINDTVILAGIESDFLNIQLAPTVKISALEFPPRQWPSGVRIKNIIPAKSKGIFFILTNKGLYAYNSERAILQLLNTKGSIVQDYLYLYEEDEKTIWLGTYGDGLYKYNPQTAIVETFGFKQGIKSDIVCGILPQGDDHLLLSTYNGLYRFNKHTGLATNRGLEHGWTHFEFNQSSFLELSDTSWLFGGVNGFHHLQQITDQEDSSKAQILLSFLKMHNEKGAGDTIIYCPTDIAHGIKIPAIDRHLQLGISWFDPERMGSSWPYFRLYPLSEQWELLPENGELNFSLVPAGKHELQLTFNLDQPPIFTLPIFAQWQFHERRDFQLLLAATVIGLLGLLSYLFFDRKFIRMKTMQLEENDKFRQRLFAYISHEFKTPLTIIFGLTNRLSKKVKEEDIVHDLITIEKHGKAMTNLVNQMIELNELQASDWQPDYAPIRLTEHLNHMIAQLQPLAENLNIRLEFKAEDQSVQQWTDIEKLKVIVNNLVSNAIKFSPQGGTVQVILRTGPTEWTLTVKDQGPGIDEREIGHIFELFYQGIQQHDKELPNSGIGLAYVKSAVEAMGGRMDVRNEKGSVFKVVFPIYPGLENSQWVENTTLETTQDYYPISLPPLEADDRLLLLIIEDTPDMAKYIKSCFPPEDYQVVWARDGEEGEQQAISCVPDIIVSDVRMPGKSGFELCNNLKHHPATNHIPIILLTALVDHASRLEGLQARADVYLPKPFREEELVMTVANLLYTRDQIRLRNVNKAEVSKDKVLAEPLIGFLKKINDLLGLHYTDPTFGVEQMCEELSLNRVQLNRKLKALSNQQPSEILRQYRLTKAAEMLIQQTETISQIAYACGFKDPSYFSKLFTANYGQSPSAYRSQQ